MREALTDCLLFRNNYSSLKFFEMEGVEMRERRQQTASAAAECLVAASSAAVMCMSLTLVAPVTLTLSLYP